VNLFDYYNIYIYLYDYRIVCITDFRKRKQLAQDTARLQKSIDDSPFTRDQLIER
jgi:hypothetical protein